MKRNPFIIFILLAGILFSCSRETDLYFTFLHSNPGKTEISKDSAMVLQDAHIANINKLAAEGLLKAAGPFEGGGGIFIIQADSPEKLNQILETDPAIKAGRFILESHPMRMSFGEIYETDSAYTMAYYDFIRTGKKIFPAKMNHALSSSGDSLKLISALQFTDSREYIYLVSNHSKNLVTNSFLKEILPPDQIISSATLWIAHESFERQ